MMKSNLAANWRKGLVAGLGALALMAQAASAADYPRKPVNLVIPYQGGITEQMGRLFGAELEKELGVSVIVDVRPGAGGTIGAKYAAKEAPDGYTLVITDGLAQETVRGRFDSFQQLEPITSLMSQPFLLYVKPDSEIKDFPGYLAAARAQPGRLSYGSVGPNTTAHVIGQSLERQAGVKLVHVPFRGGGAQALSVMAGETASGYLTAAFIKPYVEGGTLRPIAIIADQRNPVYPDVPSIAELGYPALGALNSWWGVFAPKGLPADVKKRLVEATAAIDKRGAVAAFARNSGGIALDPGPQATQRLVEEELAFWQKFLADAKE